MIEAAEGFVQLFSRDQDIDIEDLSYSLDHLALAYHQSRHSTSEDSTDWPERPSYDEVRNIVAKRLPTLGAYSTVFPLTIIDASCELGDAHDDVTDIFRDLLTIIWFYKNKGNLEGDRQFRFMYEVHWGRHLHDLRSYIHAVQFERS